ncbi:hypothetical protein [Pontibacter rugosus]|uniref:Outer membrane protein beta-barrel domain-containing protein n=1 Tax=Pontibacter rugosus TaxID=1745966 RepID=A0ABW3SLX2_9BACT
MRYLKSTLLAGLMLLAGPLLAQSKIYLEPRLGVGTFSMKSMKEFQEMVIEELEVNAKAVDNYGPYFQYGFNVAKSLNEDDRVGLFLERGSTGGRVAYKDYSGEVQVDTKLRYTSLGAFIYTLNPIKESEVKFIRGIEASLFFSKLKLESYSRIYSQSASSTEKFNSLGFGFKPFVGLQYPLFDMPTTLSLGYMLNASGAFHVPGDSDQYLVRNKYGSEKLEPSWSGLRLNLSVAFPIFKHK